MIKNTTLFRVTKIKLLFIAGMLACSASHAGSVTGKVLSITATKNSLWAVRLGTIVNRAACAAATDDLAIDNSTAGGKTMIATILAAQAQGLTVTAYGTGTCELTGDREGLLYIVVG